MHKSSFPRLTAVVAVVLMCCSALFTTVRAQCPDSTGPAPNPDSIAWTDFGETYQQIPGTNCYVTFDFCARQVADTIQVWVDTIIPDSTNNCDSITNSQLILDVGDIADSVALISYRDQVPPCIKGGSISTQIFMAACWDMNSNPNYHANQVSWTLTPCTNQYQCEKRCQWCLNAQLQLVRSNCTVTNLMTSVRCGPQPPEPWLYSVCYTLGCIWSQPSYKPTNDAIFPIDSSLRIYPNPTTESLTVTSAQAGTNVEVLDVLGRVLLTGVISKNGSLTLDVSALPNGAYYVCEGQTEIRFLKN